MSTDANGEDAKKLAQRAGKQGKDAAKNTGRAVRAAAEPVVDAAAEELRETGEKLEDTAHDAIRAARKVNVGVLGRLSSDTGVGFLATSVAIYASAIAYAKFRGVVVNSDQVISSAAKADHHITPSG